MTNPSVKSPTACVSCGLLVATNDEHRCADCAAELMRFCPHCQASIGLIIDAEVVRRFRGAAWDVHETWTDRKGFERYQQWQHVLAQREKARRGDYAWKGSAK